MAKKQVIVKETVAAAAPARAAKPRAPRVKAAQHSKVVSSESASHAIVAESSVAENTGDVIAQIAYGFWEARGRQAGSPLEDWVRAEHEYRQRIAAKL